MKIDFHVHSKYSPDCFMEPVRILKAAKSKGLGAVAISDHNTFECHAKKMDLNEMILIPAEEITLNKNHIKSVCSMAF